MLAGRAPTPQPHPGNHISNESVRSRVLQTQRQKSSRFASVKFAQRFDMDPHDTPGACRATMTATLLASDSERPRPGNRIDALVIRPCLLVQLVLAFLHLLFLSIQLKLERLHCTLGWLS